MFDKWSPDWLRNEWWDKSAPALTCHPKRWCVKICGWLKPVRWWIEISHSIGVIQTPSNSSLSESFAISFFFAFILSFYFGIWVECFKRPSTSYSHCVANVSTPSSKRNLCKWVSCKGLLARFIIYFPLLQFDFHWTEDYVTTGPRFCCPCVLFQQHLATLVIVWFKVLFMTKPFTSLLVLSDSVTGRLYTFISWWCHPFGSVVLFAAKHPLIARRPFMRTISKLQRTALT